MKEKRNLTGEQVKAKFRSDGLTFRQWAKENGFKENAVYRVVNGLSKGRYGCSHEIAVRLGLK